MNKRHKDYLDRYLNTLSSSQKAKYRSFSADQFCNDKVNTNLCAALVLKGQKTATCSMKYWYEEENEPMPVVGHLQVVLDWAKNPVCIIEIISVEESFFSEVTADFAFLEGEGDRSLEWWRKAHWDFFSQECKELSIELSEDMILVLEKFRAVYS